MRAVPGFILAITAAVLFSACAATSFSANGTPTYRAKRTDQQTVPHVEHAALAVQSRNGSVTVTADPDLDSVEIKAKVTCAGASQAEADERLAATAISITREADQTLSIVPVFPDKPRGSDGVSFEIRLPDAMGVNVKTSNGKITLLGGQDSFGGTANLRTSNGGVEVVHHDGPVTIDTSNGGIKVVQIGGPLKADTSNGSVHADGIAGSVNVDTSNGSIFVSLRDDQPGPIIADTSNGRLSVVVGPKFAGEVVFDTSNGKVVVSDQVGVIREQEVRKSEGRLVVGEGGAKSVLDTSNGSIVFKVVDSSR